MSYAANATASVYKLTTVSNKTSHETTAAEEDIQVCVVPAGTEVQMVFGMPTVQLYEVYLYSRVDLKNGYKIVVTYNDDDEATETLLVKGVPQVYRQYINFQKVLAEKVV